VIYTWDPALANGIGRLGSVANGSGVMNYTGYDAMGRVTQSNQQTPSYYYNFSYSYDLAGALTSETYPSGRVLRTAYDGAGRPTGINGTLGSTATNYVSPFPNAVEYWPHGAPNLYLYGNNVVPVNSFDKVLQPHETYATIGNNSNYWLLYVGNAWNSNGTLGYLSEGYGPGVSWGNMIWANANYQYDNANRLTGATDSHWIRNFGYL